MAAVAVREAATVAVREAATAADKEVTADAVTAAMSAAVFVLPAHRGR